MSHGHDAHAAHGHGGNEVPAGTIPPTLYHPFHDHSLDDVIGHLKGMVSKDFVEAERKDISRHREAARTHFIAHLYGHKHPDKDESLQLVSYKGRPDAEKQSEDLLRKLGVIAASKKYGEGFATLLLGVAKDRPSVLNKYVEEFLATENLPNYDALVRHVSSSDNLLDDLSGGELGNVLNAYAINVMGTEEARQDAQRHIMNKMFADTATYEHGVDVLNQAFGEHKLKIKGPADRQGIARILQSAWRGAVNPDAYGVPRANALLEEIASGGHDAHGGHDGHAPH